MRLKFLENEEKWVFWSNMLNFFEETSKFEKFEKKRAEDGNLGKEYEKSNFVRNLFFFRKKWGNSG